MREWKSEARILGWEFEEKSRVDVARKSAVSLPEIPTWLVTQSK